MATVEGQADQGMPDENKGPVILGATLTVTIAALITMATRLYVRSRMIRNIGWDDYVMTLAMVLSIVGQVLIVADVRAGAGRHMQYIDPSNFKEAFKLYFLIQPFYLVAPSLVKISVGFFLLRIAAAPVYIRIIIGIMTFMCLYTVASFLALVLQCTNLAVLWDPTATGTCWDPSILSTLNYVHVALNITTDLLFSFFIPVSLLRGLQMNNRQKLSLMCILGLGLFATAAALAKTAYIPTYGRTGDFLWDSSNLIIWGIVECNIGIVAGNLPCLKPLFRAVLGSTYGRGSHKTTVPQVGYGSRLYDTGTGRQSVHTKGWDTLATGDEEGDMPRSYGAQQSYLLTTINTEREANANGGGETEGSSQAESTGKNSVESLTRGHRSLGLGAIKVDTDINIVENSPLDFEFGEDVARKERKDMV